MDGMDISFVFDKTSVIKLHGCSFITPPIKKHSRYKTAGLFVRETNFFPNKKRPAAEATGL